MNVRCLILASSGFGISYLQIEVRDQRHMSATSRNDELVFCLQEIAAIREGTPDAIASMIDRLHPLPGETSVTPVEVGGAKAYTETQEDTVFGTIKIARLEQIIINFIQIIAVQVD